jgi:hypothetical protein
MTTHRNLKPHYAEPKGKSGPVIVVKNPELQRLEDFTNPANPNNTLKEGWDSYGAAPTTPEAIATARLLLTKRGFPFPTSDGGIVLEWENATVEILPDGSIPESSS